MIQDDYLVIKQSIPSSTFLRSMFDQLGLEIVSEEGGADLSPPNALSTLQVYTVKPKVKEVHGGIGPDPDFEPLKDFYDKMAPRYSEVLSGLDYCVPQWLGNNLGDWRGLNPVVLDLGCGNGTAIRALKDSGVEPRRSFGFDLSPNMVELARATGLYTGIGAWDLSKPMPLDKGMQFDIITALGVMEFLSNPLELLRQIRHLLTMGGEVFVTFEAVQGSANSEVAEFGLELRRYLRSQELVAELVRDADLDIVSLTQNTGYTSVRLGRVVPYIFCRLRRNRI